MGKHPGLLHLALVPGLLSFKASVMYCCIKGLCCGQSCLMNLETQHLQVEGLAGSLSGHLGSLSRASRFISDHVIDMHFESCRHAADVA